MKKISSLLLIFVIIMSACIIPISAETNNDEFTKEEAYDLFRKAYEMFSTFHNKGKHVWQINDMENSVVVDVIQTRILILESPYKTYKNSSTGEPYKNDNGYEYATFVSVPEFPEGYKPQNPFETVDKNFKYTFKTIEDVKEYLGEIFTKDMVERNMYVAVDVSYNPEKIELLRYSENNELLLYAGHSRCTNSCPMYPFSISSTSNRATLIIDFYAYGQYGSFESVEFIKENGIWKISGGTVFGYLQGYNNPNFNYNPNTGDTASYTIPALTVAALISIALPVTILRKRRRIA